MKKTPALETAKTIRERNRRLEVNNGLQKLAKEIPMAKDGMEPINIILLGVTNCRQQRFQSTVAPKAFSTACCPMFPGRTWHDLWKNDELLILTAKGEIVHVNKQVARLLKRQQCDLLGKEQNLYHILHDENERSKLAKMLSVNPNEDIFSRSNGFRIYRRIFSLHLSVGKDVCEAFLFNGCLIVPENYSGQEDETDELGPSDNIFSVGILTPVRSVNINILVESWQYVLLLNFTGGILDSDSRMLNIAGYTKQEVANKVAYSFIHPDDLNLVYFQLDNMFNGASSEGCGYSCYRLLNKKSGEYDIYLHTIGYFVSAESYVCINTKLSEEEGRREIAAIQRKYDIAIAAHPQPQVQ